MISFLRIKRGLPKGARQGSVGMDANLLPFQAIQLGAWIARKQTTVTGFKARTRASAQGTNPTPERPTLRPDYRSEATHERSELTSIDKVDSLSR